MRVVVLGANGQLGSDVVAAATRRGWDAKGLTHADVELTQPESVRSVLSLSAGELVVNTAALHNVERCEQEPALAFAVNAIAARTVAAAAAEHGAAVVHLSTDYVFDGCKAEPYVESDPPRPLNHYGVTKLAGEHLVAAANPRHFVVRTSALYGVNRCRGKPSDNFVRLMLRLAREKGEVKVVTDERVSPTSTEDLAGQILDVGATRHYGTYHATSQQECSWHEFAAAIFELSRVEVTLAAASANDFPAKVSRPLYSVLDNAALRALALDRMPHWRDALRNYLARIGELRDGQPSPG